MWFLAGHPLTSLSEEQIVDCCFEDMSILDCAGCSGGEPGKVLDWLIGLGGIDSEATYPYVVPKRQPHPADCRHDIVSNSSFAAKVGGWHWVSHGAAEEGQIAAQLPKVGPIQIAIDA